MTDPQPPDPGDEGGRDTWRVGRKVGRTIYRQAGDEPSDDDVLIGVMDTAEDAATVVAEHNGAIDLSGVEAAIVAARDAVGDDAWKQHMLDGTAHLNAAYADAYRGYKMAARRAT